MTLKVVDQTTFSTTRVKSGVNSDGLEAFDVSGGVFRDVVIGEGEMFLLPGELGMLGKENQEY